MKLSVDNDGPLSGRDVLNETIRQICLHEKKGEKGFVEYAQGYHKFCITPAGNINKDLA
jgi:hypothetical protein